MNKLNKFFIKSTLAAQLIFSLVILGTFNAQAITCINFTSHSKVQTEPLTYVDKFKNRKLNQKETFTPLVEKLQKLVNAKKVGINDSLNVLFADELSGLRTGVYGRMKRDEALLQEINDFGVPLIQKDETRRDLMLYMNLEASKNLYYRELFEPHYSQASIFIVRSNVNEGTVFSYIPTPIGRNDPKLYMALTVATGALLETIKSLDKELQHEMNIVNEGDADFARKSSPAVRIDGKRGSNPSKDALEEAIVSLHQYLVFLASDPIKNSRPEDIIYKLLSPIGSEGVTPINMFTKKLPLGFIGPTFLRGHFFNKPVSISEKGFTIPSNKFQTLLASILDRAKSLDQEAYSDSSTLPAASCLGCPMTLTGKDRVSGVDMIAGVYLKIFKEAFQYLENLKQ